MAWISSDYAAKLFEAARKEGRLEELYRGAVSYTANHDIDHEVLPEELKELTRSMSRAQLAPLVGRFLELAKQDMQIVDVEIISAAPLTPEQLGTLERQIILLVKKRLHIKVSIDPGILGGLRVIVGNHVLDNSIKSQLEEMKESLYKGVYFRHEDHAD